MYRKSKLGGGDRFFNPKQHILHDDGLLTIKASGWVEGTSHWSGHVSFSPTDPEYNLWYWIACVKKVPGIIPERELDRWRSEYAASREEGEMSGAVNASSGQHPLGEEKET